MDLAFFISLFARSLQLRDEFVPQMSPWFEGTSKRWPPVIGFGLPRVGTAAPLVTVALNPSNREIERERIPDSVDVELQWKWQGDYFHQERGQLDWFDKSDAFLEAAVGRRHRDGVPHLDLSPQPTAGGFDSIYDKKASPAQQEAALRFLGLGATTTLLPLLAYLLAEHTLKNVVVYGYLPSRQKSTQGGSATMKDFFWEVDRPFTLETTDKSTGLDVGRGKLREGHAWLKSWPALRRLDFVFLRRGPSAQGDVYSALRDAGNRVRDLGWL
ncbi:hypothetical protein D7V97_11850 [Corallococcus sp. CA053C]|uniref:hypothetical protein n=1 Tax=Corallococcus sp. CA053C TaxID=2316732 RepID=UPI000EA019B8|nr:hypothetical protein [Corallococcus sp. CA053C]RKH11171.1 hypothetical protein D7V97_11850 [Corallococcus sp. CA053C]